MTEDEAFIRAIVDSPGDDGPRSVYADWLEERSDPRAAYLRTEMAWVEVREGASERLQDCPEFQQTKVGFDPVWLARVTRPSDGVCCDHVKIQNAGPLLDNEAIARFEQKLGKGLPPEYRAFLLNYNGGTILEYPETTTPLERGREYTFYSLTPRSRPRKGDLTWWADARHRYLARYPAAAPRIKEWFLRFIPVGIIPGTVCGILLGIAEPDFGKVQFFEYISGADALAHNDSRKNRLRRARSFASFLGALPDIGYP